MTILHILKSEPDNETKNLMDIISEGENATEFRLFDEHADYEKLIDLLFQYDKAICWW